MHIFQTKTLALCLALVALGGCKYIVVPTYELVNIPISPNFPGGGQLGRNFANDGAVYGYTSTEVVTYGYWLNGEVFEIPGLPNELRLSKGAGFLVSYRDTGSEPTQILNQQILNGETIDIPVVDTGHGNGIPTVMYGDSFGNFIGYNGISRLSPEPGDGLVIWNSEGIVRELNTNLNGGGPYRVGSVMASDGMDRVLANIVNVSDSSDSQAVIWTPMSPDPVVLEPPVGAAGILVNDMSQDGTICGTAFYGVPGENGGTEAISRGWVYTDRYHILPQLGKKRSFVIAFSINQNGDIVGDQTSNDDELDTVILWKKHSLLKCYVAVNVGELFDQSAVDWDSSGRIQINDNGRIGVRTFTWDEEIADFVQTLVSLDPVGTTEYNLIFPHDEIGVGLGSLP